MSSLSFRLWILLAAALVAGCASTPAPPPAPEQPLPSGRWWQVFADPVLDDLVERAGRASPTIDAALARVAQARALLQDANAARAPQVGAGVGLSRQGGPLINAAGTSGTLFAAALNLAYDVDLGGRLALASDAAALDVQASAAALQGTRLAVQADVAQAYLELRALDAERALARSAVDAQRTALELTALRRRNGSIAEYELARAETELGVSEAEVMALDRRRGSVEHALAALVGDVAPAFRVADAEAAPPVPAVPDGIPSDVLARRPDIAAARRALQAAQARAGEARSAWFPSLTLTASGGHAAVDIGTLLQASMRAWGVGALLALPLLDGGRRDAGVRRADADVQAAAAEYRSRILVAFREVEDQLGALDLLAGEAETLARAADAAGRATALSQHRVQAGFASRLELLRSQLAEWRSRRFALQAQSARRLALVGLFRALGGGWDARA